MAKIEWWVRDASSPDGRNIYPYIDIDFDGVNEYNRRSPIVRLWERSAEHSKLKSVLDLMGLVPTGGDGSLRDYVYEAGISDEEVLCVMGWDEIPGEGRSSGSIVHYGKEWKYDRELDTVIYPGKDDE